MAAVGAEPAESVLVRRTRRAAATAAIKAPETTNVSRGVRPPRVRASTSAATAVRTARTPSGAARPANRDAAHHPEGTRRVFCLVAVVPETT